VIRALLAALALSVALAGVQTWRLDRVKADFERVKSEAATLAARLDDAARDAQVSADQCIAREASARQSARAIERIIERPVHVDPVSGCPVAGLIGADELRQAVTPSAAAS